MKAITIVVLVLFSFFSYAGPLPPDNLSGETLKVWLKDNWHAGKHQNLGYNKARRAMYSFIDKDTDGMITGVSQDSGKKVERLCRIKRFSSKSLIDFIEEKLLRIA